MPDVSRAEYDAALKRVRTLRCPGEHTCARLSAPWNCCPCARSTLAALGLDEPPTEATPCDDAKLRALLVDLWLYIGRYEWTQLTTEQKELFADVVDGETGKATVERWWRDPVVEPPTETPKACPTCPQWSMDHCSCPSLHECAREAGRR